jgi:predicted methyltransferase
MKRIVGVIAALACSLASAGPALAQIPDYIVKAVADPGRAQDAKNDDRRKAAEIVAFCGAKPGDKVLELIPGGGYFTRVFSKVVGSRGSVYAVQPVEYDEKADKIEALAKDKDYGNIALLMQPAAKLTAPQPVDIVFTSQNYHDYPDKFMGPTDPAILNAAVFAVLKPGGVYVIVDHSAEPGSGLRDTDTLHRIDEVAVKQQVVAAGFEYVGESDVLRNKSDDRTTNVFSPAIRGRTDQFVYKFRKPAK